MKKKIFILGHWMKIDGVATSLLGLLKELDYDKVDVDLMLMSQEGELLPEIPHEVNLLKTPDSVSYYWSFRPKGKKTSLLHWFIFKVSLYVAGVWYKIFRRIKIDKYGLSMIHAALLQPVLPKWIVDDEYDLALFFSCEPMLAGRVKAKKTAVWVHSDWGYFHPTKFLLNKLFARADYIVNVSSAAKKSFDDLLRPKLQNRSLVIENLLSKRWMIERSQAFCVEKQDDIKILSVGRLSPQKNYFRALDAAKMLKDSGVKFEWKIVGGGESEGALKARHNELGLGDCVIFVGSTNNPYPYYNWADMFVCTSDWEGKSVSVREAQVFTLPTIITNYGTAASQLENGVDGLIVDLTAEAVAKGIMKLANDSGLKKKLKDTCAKRDYTNKSEINKILSLDK